MPKQRPFVLAGAVLAAAGGLAGCKPSTADAPDPRTAERHIVVAQVETAAASRHRYAGVVSARVGSGLGFRVQGKIVQRMVDTGQVVKKGQPLARIDPTDYGNARVAQTGNVGAARAKWIQAAADERRNRGLVATGAISQPVPRGGEGDRAAEPPGRADDARRRARLCRAHDFGVLGVDGLRAGRRHLGGHRPHPDVPAGALRHLVPRPGPIHAKQTKDRARLVGEAR